MKNIPNGYTGALSPNGTGFLHFERDPWQHPRLARAICKESGKVITVRLNLQASNYFAWGGRGSVNGKTKTGPVTGENMELYFQAYTERES